MKQLTQKLKNGGIQVLEVSLQVLWPEKVLVKNRYSLIIVGTEGSTVAAARKSLVGKAKEQPQQVKQVIDALKPQGPVQTYMDVMDELGVRCRISCGDGSGVIQVETKVVGSTPGHRVAS